VIDACVAADRQSRALDRGFDRHCAGPISPPAASFWAGGIRAAYHLGRGGIVMRGKVEFETCAASARPSSFPKFPTRWNKAHMVERIGELVREKKIEGISALRD